jgi:hypothetical protein
LSAALVAFVSRRTNAVQVLRGAAIILANKISRLLQATPQASPDILQRLASNRD